MSSFEIEVDRINPYKWNVITSDGDFICQVDYKRTAERIRDLLIENEELKKQMNDFEFDYTQNFQEFDKDSLYVKDNYTEINLKGRNLCITVFVPQLEEYFRFHYIITGKTFGTQLTLKELE